MRSSTFNGFFTAAAFSLVAGFSSHSAAEVDHGQAAAHGATELYGEHVQFGMTRSLDAETMDRAIIARITDAIEKQDMQSTIQAQSKAEALYQRHSSVDSLLALPPGNAYQSVAVTR